MERRAAEWPFGLSKDRRVAWGLGDKPSVRAGYRDKYSFIL